VLPSDLVIDSSGRGALTRDLLRAEGLPAPEEEVLGINASYASVVLDKPAGWIDDWLMAVTIADAPHDRLGAFLFNVEGGRWLLSLNEMHGGDQPTDWLEMLAMAKTARTPTVYNAIRHARPASEVVSFRRPTSTLRHFERLDVFPRGLLAFGDAICQFNPIYGQGMSVAAQEARVLSRLLAARSASADPLDDLAQDFFAATPAVTETPWAFARTFDLQWPEATGARPPDYEETLRFTTALFELSARDAGIQKLQWEVGNCLKHAAVLEEPAVADRVRAVMSELAPA
jgi:flavin-dependent dehydrogenase